MIRQFLALSLVFLAAGPVCAQKSLPGDNPILADVRSAYEELTRYLNETKANEWDVADVEQRIQKVEAEVNRIVADNTLSDDTKRVSLGFKLNAYVLGMMLANPKVYYPKLVDLAQDCKKKYPGSSVAEGADAIVLEIEGSVLAAPQFISRLKDFHKEYPNSQRSALLVKTYAYHRYLTDLAAAKQVVEAGLKLLPGHTRLTEFQAELNKVGKPAELAGPLLNGNAFDLKALKGKVVVIDFWASWCDPCKAMTPLLKEFYKDKQADGLEIVGVSLDNDVKALEQYVKDQSIAWSQIYYTQSKELAKTAKAFGLNNIPTLFVVDRDGNLASLGVHDIRSLKSAVDRALAK